MFFVLFLFVFACVSVLLLLLLFSQAKLLFFPPQVTSLTGHLHLKIKIKLLFSDKIRVRRFGIVNVQKSLRDIVSDRLQTSNLLKFVWWPCWSKTQYNVLTSDRYLPCLLWNRLMVGKCRSKGGPRPNDKQERTGCIRLNLGAVKNRKVSTWLLPAQCSLF